MKRLFVITLICLPLIGFCQSDTIPTSLHELITSDRTYHNGDTIINFNSLNNGITKFQLSKESKKTLDDNGLDTIKGGVVVLKDLHLLQKDFQFDVKCFAGDNEWYENTVKVKVKDNDIRLINVTTDKIEMATGFRASGKIYVVIAVSMILFFTIIVYLIYLERKTRKLEKQVNAK
jgi:hypothetical protein